MSNVKVIIKHPKVYKTDGGVFELGEQPVEKTLADKLVKRGVASLVEAKTTKK